MDRFHVIPDADVIIRTRGVYKQVKVFQRGDGIYAGTAGGFVRLYAGGNTGVPSVSWDDIDIPGIGKSDMHADALGKLALPMPIKTIEGTK